ncbi:unnamed protein product [Ixodes persulcatus]
MDMGKWCSVSDWPSALCLCGFDLPRVRRKILLIDDMLGKESRGQTPSNSSRSRISHAKRAPFSCLYSRILRITNGVDTLGLLPPAGKFSDLRDWTFGYQKGNSHVLIQFVKTDRLQKWPINSDSFSSRLSLPSFPDCCQSSKLNLSNFTESTPMLLFCLLWTILSPYIPTKGVASFFFHQQVQKTKFPLKNIWQVGF